MASNFTTAMTPRSAISLQSLVGLEKEELDTPVLLIDLDRFESNIAAIAACCRDYGTGWRPHSKAHKSPEIARLLVAAGATGITCAKLSEAEMMVSHGVGDILLANQLGSASKQRRLAEIQNHGRVVAIVDTEVVLDPMAAAAVAAGTTIPVLIDVDIGMNRTGCLPGKEVVRLAEAISRRPGLRLEGIMGYEGHVLEIEPPEAKERACQESLEKLVLSRDVLLEQGHRCDIVSAGGTGTYTITAAFEGITELQAGGGIFMDAMYRESCHVEDLQFALTVLATVSSRQHSHVVLDAGFKTLSQSESAPRALGREDLDLRYLSAEHGVFSVRDGCPGPQVGERIELLPWYSDSTTFLHDRFVGLRRGVVECVWEIAGRGLLT
jgi:D-serine deaminase-like pyridoxal phosphate-dependent protein